MNRIECSRLLVFCLLLFDFCCDGGKPKQMQTVVAIGIVQDLSSSFGSMLNLCMDMAISDFYAAHPNYRTRLQLHKKDAKSVADSNLAVLELVKNEDVRVILGPQGSTEEKFAAAVGKAVQVPIVSFTARSSALSYTENRYFVRATSDDADQAQVLAAISNTFSWPKVVVLYEDTENGIRFLSHLIKPFQDVGIKLANMTSIPTSANGSRISKELEKLKTKESRVFLVHMNPDLGFRLFSIARKAGMMSKGYAWVVTDSLSIFLDPVRSYGHHSMEGVLGLKPRVFPSKKLSNFKRRFKSNLLLNNSGPIMELNIYGLWAYDAVTALAIAVENISVPFLDSIVSFGPSLLDELSSTEFKGLAGYFQLVEGRLKSSPLEIVNVIRSGLRKVGFFTLERGVTKELGTCHESTTHLSLTGNITWHGDYVVTRKVSLKLRVGVPWNPGFKEFVHLEKNHTNAIGLAADIFFKALERLPFHVDYDFYCYNKTSYDDMLKRIPEEYDMVVGDTTLWAPRASYVDFSLPYTESSVVLVVRNEKPFGMWIFVRPLRWDLWLAFFVSCILMGVVLRILEHRAVADARQAGMLYWSPIAILAFQDQSMVSNRWSVFVLVCWLFMAVVLMQSFTANLSAILTVDQLRFGFSGDYRVGYKEGSFMKAFLMEKLHINESTLIPHHSLEGFHENMSKGGNKGGIDAIFDEIPYMKLFLIRYKDKYKMIGPSYPTDGFGFAFPKDSPLVANFSRAILNVTQGPEMNRIEQHNFGPGYSSPDPFSSAVSQGSPGLTCSEFAGLFIILGSLTVFALFCSETPAGRKFTAIVGRFIHNDRFFRSNSHRKVHTTEGDEHATHAGEDVNDATSPPSGEGREVDLITRDEEHFDETCCDNETSASQEVRVGIEE